MLCHPVTTCLGISLGEQRWERTSSFGSGSVCPPGVVDPPSMSSLPRIWTSRASRAVLQLSAEVLHEVDSNRLVRRLLSRDTAICNVHGSIHLLEGAVHVAWFAFNLGTAYPHNIQGELVALRAIGRGTQASTAAACKQIVWVPCACLLRQASEAGQQIKHARARWAAHHTDSRRGAAVQQRLAQAAATQAHRSAAHTRREAGLLRLVSPPPELGASWRQCAARRAHVRVKARA